MNDTSESTGLSIHPNGPLTINSAGFRADARTTTGLTITVLPSTTFFKLPNER